MSQLSATWNAGYITTDPYMETYHGELSPTRLQYQLLLQGFMPPGLDGHFNYCELGFGRGRSLAVHAASHPNARFQGTDFNPTHANEAQQLIQATAGGNAEVFEDSFAEFLDRDGPKFDFIVLHGIWSWVNAAARRDICNILRHKMNSGGVVYFSFNALPNWAPLMPARELLVTLTESLPASMSPEDKAAQALKLVEEMANLKGFAFEGALRTWLETAKKHNKAYLAHEYLNNEWTPMYFKEVAATLDEQSKLSFLGPALPSHFLSRCGLPADKRAFIQRHSDPVARETLFDFMAGTTFRQDLFGRGVQKLTPSEHWRLLGDTPAIFTPAIHTLPETLTFSGGQYQPAAHAREALLDLAKSADSEEITVSQLANHPQFSRTHRPEFVTLLTALVAADLLVPCVRGGTAAGAAGCSRLNTALRQQVLSGRSTSIPQASPRTGTALQGLEFVNATLLNQVIADPSVSAEELTRILAQQIAKQGLTLNEDGKPIVDAAKINAKMSQLVTAFQRGQHQACRALAII